MNAITGPRSWLLAGMVLMACSEDRGDAVEQRASRIINQNESRIEFEAATATAEQQEQATAVGILMPTASIDRTANGVPKNCPDKTAETFACTAVLNVFSNFLCTGETWRDQEHISNVCTAFMIKNDPGSPAVFATAGHCVGIGPSCSERSVVLRWRRSLPSFPGGNPSVFEQHIYQCSRVLAHGGHTTAGLTNGRDWAVFEVDRHVTGGGVTGGPLTPDREPLVLSTLGTFEGEEISSIGYPLGLPVKIEPEGHVGGLVTNRGPGTFYAFRDAEDGDSGAPIFDSIGEVIGISTGARGPVQLPNETCSRHCFDCRVIPFARRSRGSIRTTPTRSRRSRWTSPSFRQVSHDVGTRDDPAGSDRQHDGRRFRPRPHTLGRRGTPRPSSGSSSTSSPRDSWRAHTASGRSGTTPLRGAPRTACSRSGPRRIRRTAGNSTRRPGSACYRGWHHSSPAIQRPSGAPGGDPIVPTRDRRAQHALAHSLCAGLEVLRGIDGLKRVIVESDGGENATDLADLCFGETSADFGDWSTDLALRALADWGMTVDSWQAKVVRRATRIGTTIEEAVVSPLTPEDWFPFDLVWQVDLHFGVSQPVAAFGASLAPQAREEGGAAALLVTGSSVSSFTADPITIADAELALFKNLGQSSPKATFNTFVQSPDNEFGVNHPIPGDVDNGGCVDSADLCTMMRNDVWQHRAVPPNTPAVQADLNRDGWVNEADRTILMTGWGSGCANPSPPPALGQAVAACHVQYARRWLSFEDQRRVWSVGVGSVQLQTTTTTPSHLQKALQVNGCQYATINSPLFNTSELAAGSKLAFDVRLPTAQANPYWLGDVQLHLTIPGANVFNAWIGWKSFAGQPTGAYHTVKFDLPQPIRTALAGSHPGAQIHIALNTGNCLAPILIDNVRIQN